MNAAPNRKKLLLGGGHLAAAWALAFAQPLLDLLGENPDFFVARGNTPGDILILAFGFTLLPPLVLLALEAAILRFSPRAYEPVHLTLLGLIAAVFFGELISKAVPGPAAAVLLAAVVCGALFVAAVRRFDFVRNLLDLLILAPAAILAVFIFISPASKLIFPGPGVAVASGSPGGANPIVLVIFDELGTADLMTRAGRIDRRRFPGFARLSREATWYRDNSTTDFFTPRAVPGILTGKVPPDDALPIAREQPENIFTLLGRGRPLHVMEPVTALCPDSLCPDDRPGRPGQSGRLGELIADLRYVVGRLVLPAGLADRLPDVANTFQGFGQARDPGLARTGRYFVKQFGTGPEAAGYRRFIRGIPASRRGLTVMHLILPHQPWRFTPDGRLYNRSPIDSPWEPGTDRWRTGPAGIATAQQRMFTQTGFADTLVAEIEETLRRKGLWDDAILVVTADHGTSFEGDGVARRRVDPRAMGEVANPPLFIKYPGQKHGRVSRAHSLTLDILPTIARAVGAKGLPAFGGLPLQDPVPARPVTVKDVLHDSREVSVPVGVMAAQRRAAIARADRRLGRGPLFTLGPAPSLLGRKAAPVPGGAGPVTLDDPGLWDDVDPGREPLPVFVTGTVAGGAPDGPAAGAALAIALNGTVRGTARVFGLDGELRFGALVDPAALEPGRNEVGIHAVRGGRLVPLGGN